MVQKENKELYLVVGVATAAFALLLLPLIEELALVCEKLEFVLLERFAAVLVEGALHPASAKASTNTVIIDKT